MGRLDISSEGCARMPSRLSGGEVHVWCASLQPTRSRVASLNELAADERERARRFRFHKDFERFVLSRVALRGIISRYLDVKPSALRFSYGAYGKPALAKPHEGLLSFNLSRSHDVALYAITSGANVGIDVERTDTDIGTDELSERFFTPSESACIRRFRLPEKSKVFLRYWVSKEAYVKATGYGLALPLDSFEVSFDERPELMGTEAKGRASSRWALSTLDGLNDYTAAIVADQYCSKIRRCGWYSAS